jgi:hypothetical protein
MSTSYQDIDSRLGVVERKIDFLMNLASVTKRTVNDEGVPRDQKLTLLELYRELQAENATIEPTKEIV